MSSLCDFENDLVGDEESLVDLPESREHGSSLLLRFRTRAQRVVDAMEEQRDIQGTLHPSQR